MHDHLVAKLGVRGGYDVFVSCYCETDDLVSQWRGYGGGGSGYSIGFPWRDISRGGAALLIGVVYGDVAVIEAANRAVDVAMNRLSDAIREPSGNENAVSDILTSFSITLLILAICAKKKVFEFEQECRLIYLTQRPKSALRHC